MPEAMKARRLKPLVASSASAATALFGFDPTADSVELRMFNPPLEVMVSGPSNVYDAPGGGSFPRPSGGA
jgi:hypothetical protein